MVVSCVEDNDEDRVVVVVVVASSVPILLLMLMLMLMLMLLHKYVLRDKFFSAIRCISPSLTFTKPNQTKPNQIIT